MSWTAPAFMAEMKERLEAWPALSDVDVYTAPISRKLTPREVIVFIDAPGTQEWAAIGEGAKSDDYSVSARLVVEKKGSGEAKAVETRDRAGVIVAAVEACLRDIAVTPAKRSALAADIGANQITALNLADISLTGQGANDGTRWCSVDFEFQVSARI